MTVVPLGKETQIGFIVWYDKKEVRVEVMWSVTPVSKIQKLGCLTSGEDDLEVKARGVLETSLALGFELGCDYCNKPIRLWYCYWVKPKDLEIEESAPYVSLLTLESSEPFAWEALPLFSNPRG